MILLTLVKIIMKIYKIIILIHIFTLILGIINRVKIFQILRWSTFYQIDISSYQIFNYKNKIYY